MEQLLQGSMPEKKNHVLSPLFPVLAALLFYFRCSFFSVIEIVHGREALTEHAWDMPMLVLIFYFIGIGDLFKE